MYVRYTACVLFPLNTPSILSVVITLCTKTAKRNNFKYSISYTGLQNNSFYKVVSSSAVHF